MCIIWRLVSREFQSRVSTILQKLEHFFTLSHTLSLHDSHLNTGLLIELQTWHGIKSTKWLIKSNLTTWEEEWRRSDGRDMVSENGKYVCRNGDCKETSRKFPSSKTNPRFLGPIWLVSLSNVVWVFLIYMWVKKCVEICEKLFKMWKCWLELTNQTGPYLFTIMPQVKS